MDLLMLMEHLQPKEDLSHDIGSHSLRYFLHILIDDVGQCAAVHVLDEHEEAIHVVVGGVVVDDVLVGAHRHDSGLDFDLVQDLLFGDFHHADCPAFVGELAVEGLVDRAHGALAELLGETVELIGIVRQEGDSLDLLVELGVSQ
jgi:hypothetical protein